jgi:ABC-type uncharacterized transport system substrate-binding protein
MRIVIYEGIPATTWAWHLVDSNEQGGINVTGFTSEGDARTNVTETLELFGIDPESVTIEVA